MSYVAHEIMFDFLSKKYFDFWYCLEITYNCTPIYIIYIILDILYFAG